MDRMVEKNLYWKWIVSLILITFIISFLIMHFKNKRVPEIAKINSDTIEVPPNHFLIDSTLKFQLNLIADSVVSPLNLVYANDGSHRLFITEQSGRIMIFKNGKMIKKPFLNIHNKLLPQNNYYSETGLLGLAFHPNFKSNGKFYVYYTGKASLSQNSHKSIIAEYKIGSNANEADSTSERILIGIEKTQGNHNGGQLAFGKDGFLYIGFGDGGGLGDNHGSIGNGQNKNSFFGKILRIDVDRGKPYSTPIDNPFYNKEGVDEIYALGLRNPWRFSFDRETGELYCGDVGENSYEEINIIKKGENYGWKAMEGKQVFDSTVYNIVKEGLKLPIYQYDHSAGKSITGGYVYRGKKFSALKGKYFFADWEGKLWYLKENQKGTKERYELNFSKSDRDTISNLSINSFGEDAAGEIYILCQTTVGASSPTGKIYQISLQ